MAKTAANVPVTVVPGGDSYLNDARTKALCAQALKARPDAELIELDATSADQYAFDEAVSPSLLSDVAVVKLVNLQNADEKLAEALVTYTKQAAKDPNGSSVVICQHEGGVKGRKIIDQLVKAGARKEDVPDLKKPPFSLMKIATCWKNICIYKVNTIILRIYISYSHENTTPKLFNIRMKSLSLKSLPVSPLSAITFNNLIMISNR